MLFVSGTLWVRLLLSVEWHDLWTPARFYIWNQGWLWDFQLVKAVEVHDVHWAVALHQVTLNYPSISNSWNYQRTINLRVCSFADFFWQVNFFVGAPSFLCRSLFLTCITFDSQFSWSKGCPPRVSRNSASFSEGWVMMCQPPLELLTRLQGLLQDIEWIFCSYQSCLHLLSHAPNFHLSH